MTGGTGEPGRRPSRLALRLGCVAGAWLLTACGARQTAPPEQGDARAPLVGRWQGTAMEDSGGPLEPIEQGGAELVFHASGTVARGCDLAGVPYRREGDVVVVELGGSEVRWQIVTLDAERLAFREGPDVFHFRRGPPCE